MSFRIESATWGLDRADNNVILDPQQLSNTGPATCVDDIIAKLFQRAWQHKAGPQSLGWMHMVSDPAEASDLLSRPDDFPKCYSFLTELGRSRFDADASDWEQRRDLTQPLYRDAARTANRDKLRDAYDRWLTDEAIQSGQVNRALLAAASEVFLHALGGQADGGPMADWLISLRDTALLAQHIAMFQPAPAEVAKLQSAVSKLRAELRELLRQDQALMTAFADRTKDFDAGFDLLGEITINLFAGTETTVSTMCWVLNILARQPDLQDRIAAQAQQAGSDAPALTHLIQEVMRYCPPVPLLVRTVAKSQETLAGRPVPEGAMIALSIVGLHHHHDHWTDPARFDPARPEFVQNTYHRRAYLPFSAGPRVCGGLGLARAEIAIGLSRILAGYRIAPVAGPIRYEFSLTLRPLGTSQLQFMPR